MFRCIRGRKCKERSTHGKTERVEVIERGGGESDGSKIDGKKTREKPRHHDIEIKTDSGKDTP